MLLNGINDLIESSKWDDFIKKLNQLKLDDSNYKKVLEIGKEKVEKFKAQEDGNYLYYLLHYILLLKKKLIELNKYEESFLFYRKQLDKLYELILKGEEDLIPIYESIFMIDLESVKEGFISESLLKLINKYEIEKFTVPYYWPFEFGIIVAYELDFLINYGLGIKKILKDKDLDEDILSLYIRYILTLSNNISFYNDEYDHILDIFKLLFEIEAMLKTNENIDSLYLELLDVVKSIFIYEYSSKKISFEEDQIEELTDKYFEISNKIENELRKLQWSTLSPKEKVRLFLDDLNKSFMDMNKEKLIYPIFKYLTEMYELDEEVLDLLINIYINKKLPKYKSEFLLEIILEQSTYHYLFKRKDYKLLIKKYEEVDDADIYKDNYFYVAYSYGELGNIQKAKEIYIHCIEIGKGSASVYNNLGCMCDREGKKEEALECFKIAHKMDKDTELYIRNIISTENDINKKRTKDDIDSILWDSVPTKYISSELNHLEEDEIRELMKSYYTNTHKNDDLIEKYNLNVRNTELYKVFPPIVYEDKFCIYCKSNMITERPSKSNYYINDLNKIGVYCPNCKHEFNQDKCRCDTCTLLREEKKKAEEIEKRKLIKKVYDLSKNNPRKYEDLNIYEKLYLTTLAREGLNEDMTMIQPISTFDRKLAPTDKYQKHIIDFLIDNNIIRPHPDSPIEAFKQDDNFPNTYYTYAVYYHINLRSDKFSHSEMLQRIITPYEEDVVAEIETLYNIWIEIAMEEVKENLLYNMEAVGFDYNIGEKTKKIIKELLNNFSVGQIFYMNYRASNNALRFYNEKNVTRKHAANSVIGNIQRYAEKVIANGWDVTQYRRPYDTPQTTISEVFFNRYLKIAEKGFYETPSMEIIKERRSK